MASSQPMLFASILLMACALVVFALMFRERTLPRPNGDTSLRVRLQYPESSRNSQDHVSSEEGEASLLSTSLFAMHASQRLNAPSPSGRRRGELGPVIPPPHTPHPVPDLRADPAPDPAIDATPHLPLTLDPAPDPTLHPVPSPGPATDPLRDTASAPHPLPDSASASDPLPDPAPAAPAPDSTPLSTEPAAAPADPVALEPSVPSQEVDGPPHSPASSGPEPAAGFEAAAPWTAPAGTSFPYQGLENDLDGLLKVQASADKWISIITMSGKVKRFVLNCIYTLHKYGAWPHFILVTFDSDSLEVCRQLNLPCFSGGAFTTREVSDGDHSYGSGNATEIYWAKQRLAMELLRRGYNVHGSDADVVYFRHLHDSYQGIFQKTDADAIFATEEWIRHLHNLINAGVYAIRSNERSVRFFEQWTADTEHGRGGVDQEKLNRLFMQGFLLCDSMTSCRAVQNNGNLFAVFRHKSFFPSNYCAENTLRPSPCDLRRLYLHQLCIYGWPSKAERWSMLNLWFIDEDLKPMFSDGEGPNGPHAFMPCKDQVAWTDIEQGSIAKLL